MPDQSEPVVLPLQRQARRPLRWRGYVGRRRVARHVPRPRPAGHPCRRSSFYRVRHFPKLRPHRRPAPSGWCEPRRQRHDHLARPRLGARARYRTHARHGKRRPAEYPPVPRRLAREGPRWHRPRSTCARSGARPGRRIRENGDASSSFTGTLAMIRLAATMSSTPREQRPLVAARLEPGGWHRMEPRPITSNL